MAHDIDYDDGDLTIPQLTFAVSVLSTRAAAHESLIGDLMEMIAGACLEPLKLIRHEAAVAITKLHELGDPADEVNGIDWGSYHAKRFQMAEVILARAGHPWRASEPAAPPIAKHLH